MPDRGHRRDPGVRGTVRTVEHLGQESIYGELLKTALEFRLLSFASGFRLFLRGVVVHGVTQCQMPERAKYPQRMVETRSNATMNQHLDYRRLRRVCADGRTR